MNAHRDEPATKRDLERLGQELTDKIDENSKRSMRTEVRSIK